MRTGRQLVAACLCATLAACGGSSAGGGSEALSLAQQRDALRDEVLSEDVSNPGRLPQTGTARYDGVMTARLPTGIAGQRREYLGDLRLNVDFGADRNQVRGRAHGFETQAGRALSGELAIRGGDLYRGTDPDANYTFTGNVDGRLRDAAGRYDIDAAIEGEFRGRRRTGVSGLLFGDVTGPSGQDIFDGDFVASRN